MRLSALLFAMAVLVATATFDDQMRERAVYLESLEWPDESAALSTFFRSPLPLFTKLSREEAGRLTDRGQPFVVTDASFGRAEWSCEFLKTSFPKAGLARQPYSQDSLDMEGPTLGSLFDPGWNATFQLVVPVDDVRNPNVVSWFTPSLAGPDYASLAGALSVPYFLDDSASNRANIEGRIEFFLGAKGSGVSSLAVLEFFPRFSHCNLFRFIRTRIRSVSGSYRHSLADGNSGDSQCRSTFASSSN